MSLNGIGLALVVDRLVRRRRPAAAAATRSLASNVAIAGIVVAGAGNAVWLLTGRRALGLRREGDRRAGIDAHAQPPARPRADDHRNRRPRSRRAEDMTPLPPRPTACFVAGPARSRRPVTREPDPRRTQRARHALRGVPAVSDYLPFLVVGVTTGSLYGLAGIGLVLTYKTSGIFNFAHGAIAAAGAYAFYELHTVARAGRGRWRSSSALVGGGLVFGVVLERLARAAGRCRRGHARSSPPSASCCSSRARSRSASAPTTRDFPQFLPTATFQVVGVHVQVRPAHHRRRRGWSLAGGAVRRSSATAGSASAMRAVVDDPVARLASPAPSPARVRRTAWVIGCGFAALSGILIAPTPRPRRAAAHPARRAGLRRVRHRALLEPAR